MRGRLRLSATLPSLFFAGLWIPAHALAQERAQESTQTRSREPDEQEIVVEAERGDRTLIDRETYIVRDTPLAQTRTAVDVIQNLPSVTIDAAGQLRLLGNRNVKILIDGRDVPDANVILSTLQASQIARIEVMTNPSAQFSAYGSAGIINIILRRSFADGLAGSSVVGAGNLGYFTAKLSPTWSNGTWSISASPSLTVSDSSSERLVERVGPTADPGLNRIEDETGRGTSRTATATGQASFRPSQRKRYDLTASISRLNGESERSALISSPLNSFPPFAETSAGRSTLRAETVSLERTVNGDQEGEEFKLALSWSHFAASTQIGYADLLPAQPRAFTLESSTDQTLSGIKADQTVHLGEHDILSVGAEIQWEKQRIRDTAAGELLSGPIDTSETFTGRSFDMSAYGTLQTELGSFRILPGLRVQRRRFEFDRASGFAPTGETLFFPSLHVERRFGNLTTTFSIAQRADWPSIGQFLPYRRITGPTTADTGNPARPGKHAQRRGGRAAVDIAPAAFPDPL